MGPFDQIDAEDFQHFVLPEVIGAHAWGTDMLMVRRGKKWPAWKTGILGPSAAGQRMCSHVEWFELDRSERKCVFRAEDTERTPSKKLDPIWRSWSGRMLLERISDAEQLDVFKAFLRSAACEAWSSALQGDQ
ncbi:unnamed protein product [Effrenium voratum]|nr:unnamed protein product [Effrenium voratum]